jgi:hypothetical protein
MDRKAKPGQPLPGMIGQPPAPYGAFVDGIASDGAFVGSGVVIPLSSFG